MVGLSRLNLSRYSTFIPQQHHQKLNSNSKSNPNMSQNSQQNTQSKRPHSPVVDNSSGKKPKSDPDLVLSPSSNSPSMHSGSTPNNSSMQEMSSFQKAIPHHGRFDSAKIDRLLSNFIDYPTLMFPRDIDAAEWKTLEMISWEPEFERGLSGYCPWGPDTSIHDIIGVQHIAMHNKGAFEKLQCDIEDAVTEQDLVSCKYEGSLYNVIQRKRGSGAIFAKQKRPPSHWGLQVN